MGVFIPPSNRIKHTTSDGTLGSVGGLVSILKRKGKRREEGKKWKGGSFWESCRRAHRHMKIRTPAFSSSNVDVTSVPCLQRSHRYAGLPWVCCCAEVSQVMLHDCHHSAAHALAPPFPPSHTYTGSSTLAQSYFPFSFCLTSSLYLLHPPWFPWWQLCAAETTLIQEWDRRSFSLLCMYTHIDTHPVHACRHAAGHGFSGCHTCLQTHLIGLATTSLTVIGSCLARN